MGMNSSIFKRIMVATDGSESAKDAVATAIGLARLDKTKLYAVHVISLGFLYESLPTDEELEEAYREKIMTEGKQATAYVENAGRAANIEVEPVILRGVPAEEIIGFAEKNDIDLIIMGTHGRTGIQKFLLGSVAEKVVRHATKSVLVVR
jgi:nucleotide-binding universal stress UspA family protein